MWGNIRPRACLKLGTHAAFWAESVRRWGQRQDQCWVRSLPSGLLRPSPVELNIGDAAEVKTLLRALTRPKRRVSPGVNFLFPQVPRPVVLVLPDLCVRASVIRLENLPARSDEQLTLIRWRLSQEQLFPVSGTKVVFQRLGANGSKASGEVSVLAVAIREVVLEQYESLCAAVGLCPTEVDTVSFRLFNMWARSTRWFRRTRLEDLVWVSVFDGGLTVLIFHDHQLVFLRTKVLPGSLGPGESRGGLDCDWLAQEIAASIGSCAEQCSEVDPRQMVLASEELEPDSCRAIGDATGLEVEELGWSQARCVGWQLPSLDIPVAAIPAVAGLLGKA